MDHGHHHHHYQYSSASGLNIDSVSGSDNRFPQWSIQETQDFLLIRAELDQAFMETKRNKLLWDVVSTRMKEKGYNRSPEQCKCKWKNLVTRYKGCETMGAEGIRQHFPFYNDLQTIFTARMQRMLWQEAEGGGGSTSSRKKTAAQFSSDEDDEEEEDAVNEHTSEGGVPKKKRKTKTANNNNININPPDSGGGNSIIMNGIKEMMDDFMRQQMQIEMQWLKAYEKREEERRMKEMEWRQTMEALENERMMMERRWREREEQRRIREEQRAEKRDALVTALLNKLRREDN